MAPSRPKNTNGSSSNTELGAWYELSTSRCLISTRADNRNRISRSQGVDGPSAEEQLLQNPYTTPMDLTQNIVNEDADLSLWATLIDHLQTRPLFSSPPPIEARHGYIPNTIRRAKTAKLTSGASASLDPDFTLRDSRGQGLAGEDQTYQTPLLETLWDLVRYGELDHAVRVCEEGGEPWRAASIMGGRRWDMGGLSESAQLNPVQADISAQERAEVSPLTGNRSRALWKKSCRAIAKNVSFGAKVNHKLTCRPRSPTLSGSCTLLLLPISRLCYQHAIRGRTSCGPT